MSEFGPLLPPRLTQKREDEANEEDTGLSPRLGRTRVENTSGKAVELTSPSGTFGPTLPPGLSSSTPADGKSRSATIGPVLPAHLDSNTKEEEVIIGPLPPSVGSLEEVSTTNQRLIDCYSFIYLQDELARKRMEIEARSVSMRKKLTRQVSESFCWMARYGELYPGPFPSIGWRFGSTKGGLDDRTPIGCQGVWWGISVLGSAWVAWAECADAFICSWPSQQDLGPGNFAPRILIQEIVLCGLTHRQTGWGRSRLVWGHDPLSTVSLLVPTWARPLF